MLTSLPKNLVFILLLTLHSFHQPFTVSGFSFQKNNMNPNPPCNIGGADPSTLPSDPSLNLITNLDLGDKKLEVMKACSKAIASITGKPESYVGVAITDNASVMFGGDADAPAAFGNVYSLGAINMENNGQITKEVTELLEPFGLDQGRIYINFFDMDRANIGWNKRTFAG